MQSTIDCTNRYQTNPPAPTRRSQIGSIKQIGKLVMSSSRQDSYKNLLEIKKQDLGAVMRDLAIPQTQENERKLNSRLEQLLEDIEELERKLAAYGSNQSVPDRSKLIYKINYDEAVGQIKEVLDSFDNSSCSALFLVEQSSIFCGEYCVQHLNDLLVGEGLINRPVPVAFSDGGSPVPEDFVRKLGEQLSVTITNNLSNDVAVLVKTLYDSLKGHNILFLKIDLDLACPNKIFLEWLVQDFWCKLICQPHLSINISGLKVIGVMTTKRELSQELLDDILCKNKSTGRLVSLPLEIWEEEKIHKWLTRFSGFSPSKVNNIATSIFDSTQGYPDRAKREILDVLKQ